MIGTERAISRRRIGWLPVPCAPRSSRSPAQFLAAGAAARRTPRSRSSCCGTANRLDSRGRPFGARRGAHGACHIQASRSAGTRELRNQRAHVSAAPRAGSGVPVAKATASSRSRSKVRRDRHSPRSLSQTDVDGYFRRATQRRCATLERLARRRELPPVPHARLEHLRKRSCCATAYRRERGRVSRCGGAAATAAHRDRRPRRHQRVAITHLLDIRACRGSGTGSRWSWLPTRSCSRARSACASSGRFRTSTNRSSAQRRVALEK